MSVRIRGGVSLRLGVGQRDDFKQLQTGAFMIYTFRYTCRIRQVRSLTVILIADQVTQATNSSVETPKKRE